MARRVTAKEIAQELGISVMTVSRALNNRPNVDENTRQRVLETARRLGYTPNHIAKSLVTQKTDTIGVVVPEITHSFFPEAIRGIEEATYEAGYHLILTHSAERAEREADALFTLEAKRVDGILISAAQSARELSVYQEIMARGIPIVFFDRRVEGLQANFVSINDEESARQITEHLLEHGYRRIAHLAGPINVSIGRERLSGFQKAFQNYGLTVDEELVVEAGFHEEGGYRAMCQLLQLPQNRWPRAVVAVNDPAAFGAMQAIQEKGLRIPEDIAIVGFSNDIRAALMPTPLTTVHQPAYEVGRQAALRLIELVEKADTSIREIIVKTELVIRRSCGCNES